MRRALGWVIVLCLSCVGAQAAEAPAIPQALQDWQAWVLHGNEQRACPFLSTRTPQGDDDYQCAWPGHLSLEVDKDGARFELDVQVDGASWVGLPGDRDAWPQQVQIGNAPAVVLDRNGQPSLRLTAGNYDIHGAFAWNERPVRLRVPQAVALVDLRVDNAPVVQPERDGDLLTLGEATSHQRQADALSLRVFRRVDDGIPPLLTTRLALHVAGSAREQLLGPALPAGFVATSLGGDLPARLDPDGRLRVQLRPGDWSLELVARATSPLHALTFHAPPAPWPRQEIWSYGDDPALRTTRIEGTPPIDPVQAGVPEDWRALPAFAMAEDATLTVVQSARGLDANAGDHLQLVRQLWVDFSGAGLSADDRLKGKLRGADRLDVAAPWTLERADLGDDSQPLLVTRGANANLGGIEIRQRDLDVHAGLRRAGYAGGQSATGGWQRTLDGVDVTLHLPYGYRLLGAPGADSSPDSWIAQWNLLDLFVAAVIALLAWRLLGWQWGLVALGFVVLSQSEPGAPRWTAGLAVALALAARALPQGRLRAVARYAGMAMLALAVLATLPFGAEQVRDALHPQLEGSSFLARVMQSPFEPAPVSDASKPGFQEEDKTAQAPSVQEQSSMAEPAAPPPPLPPPADIAPRVDNQPQSLQSVVVTAAQISGVNIVVEESYPPGLVVQSGRGVPGWNDYGSSYRLGWSGPVTPDETYRLVILPSWATRILRVAMLLLLVAWLAAIARAFDLSATLPRWPRRAASGAAALLLFALASPHVHAQATPSPEILSQLRARLLEPPKCVPQCAASPAAQVTAQGSTIDVVIAADADAGVAFPLPKMDAPTALSSVTLDGKPASGLVRRDDGIWIALDRGVHRIGVDFVVGDDADTVALRFPLPPPRVEMSAQGWQASGLDGSRLLSDTLTLSRVRASTTSAPDRSVAQALPPYVQLTRSIALGIDSRIDNQVQRVAPAQGGFSVSLPLLPGEHVSTPGLKAEGGRVTITFDSDEGEKTWTSTLDPSSALALHAPGLGERAEIWEVASAPLLHLGFSGVPESDNGGGQDGVHVFRPLPGETLEVRIDRPSALRGESLAFDRADASVSLGERALETALTLDARSTRGGEHVIDLPRDAQLLEATRDGETLALNPRDGHVGLPLQPGTQTFKLRFRESGMLASRASTPAVDLHARAANISVSLSLPQDRWVLWTWGPSVGPAVLYWSELIALLIVALLLARFAPTPLRWWQWLLLGLGFSTFAWSAYALVALWLIVLGLRARSERIVTFPAFNLAQVAIAALTAIALLCLVSVVPHGLLGRPDMRVDGNGSSAWMLRWFSDQTRGPLPRAGAFSLPLWSYKLVMLAWALWLANALIGWLRWGFDAWTRGGYWKSASPKAATSAPAPPAKPAPVPPPPNV